MDGGELGHFSLLEKIGEDGRPHRLRSQPAFPLSADKNMDGAANDVYCWPMSACQSRAPSAIPILKMLTCNPRTIVLALLLPLAAVPLAAQNQTEQQYITSVNTAINNLVGTLGAPTQPIIIGGNLGGAYGTRVGNMDLSVVLDWVDGLESRRRPARRVQSVDGYVDPPGKCNEV